MPLCWKYCNASKQKILNPKINHYMFLTFLTTYFDGLFRWIKSQNILCLGLIHNEHVSVTLWCTQVVPFKITSYACCNIYEIIDTIFYSVVQYSIKIHIIISFPWRLQIKRTHLFVYMYIPGLSRESTGTFDCQMGMLELSFQGLLLPYLQLFSKYHH